MSRVFIVLKEDIIDFPPVLSIIEVLARLGYEVVHLGTYTDVGQKSSFEARGVTFVSLQPYDGKAFLFKKLFQQARFKKGVIRYLNSTCPSEDDRVWLIQSETVYLLSSLVYKYKTICHMFEFVEPKVNWKYRLLNPFLNLSDTLQHAHRVVCCEYNRAHIAKGLFQLKELPTILPNKLITNESSCPVVPQDVLTSVNRIKEIVDGKKVILYQGIFLDAERRLEEFCEAMSALPDEYVFIAMGKGSEMYDNLKRKYESNRIIFIPFIRPPYHLLITEMASIGVLSYFPRPGSIGRTLNPLYCAPNKIFEYSRFGIPMISNDVPALRYAYLEHHCGLCIDDPMTPEQIANAINAIMDDYEHFSDGAHGFYESVDIEAIVKSLI